MAKLQQANGGMPSGAGARSFIPLKVNSSGVMPIIFAQAIMFPLYLTQSESLQQNEFLQSLSDFNGVAYNLLFFFMIAVLHISTQLLRLTLTRWLMT